MSLSIRRIIPFGGAALLGLGAVLLSPGQGQAHWGYGYGYGYAAPRYYRPAPPAYYARPWAPPAYHWRPPVYYRPYYRHHPYGYGWR